MRRIPGATFITENVVPQLVYRFFRQSTLLNLIVRMVLGIWFHRIKVPGFDINIINTWVQKNPDGVVFGDLYGRLSLSQKKDDRIMLGDVGLIRYKGFYIWIMRDNTEKAAVGYLYIRKGQDDRLTDFLSVAVNAYAQVMSKSIAYFDSEEGLWVYTAESSKTGLSDIPLHSAVRPALVEFVQKVRDRWDNARYAQLGLFLHGPSGTGKTTIAAAISHELQIPLFVAGSELKTKRNFTTMVGNLWSYQVVSIDEVDQYDCFRDQKRGSGDSDREETTLSDIFGYLTGPMSPQKTVTVMTTNHMSDVSDRVYRQGRCDMKLEIPAVDSEGIRYWLINRYGANLPDDLSFPEMTLSYIFHFKLNYIEDAEFVDAFIDKFGQ